MPYGESLLTKARAKKRRGRGRPPGSAATAHDAILDAVHELLQGKSVRELTIEEVAQRAGVGKPTIYRWWPSKAALVMDMFEERVAPQFRVSDAATAEATIRRHVTVLIRLLNGFFGKVSAEIIGEGQSEPDVLREYCDRYVLKRRALSHDVIQRAKESGELRDDVDPQLLIDMVYAPIYYRLLLRHEKLDKRFGEALVDSVMAYAKGSPTGTRRCAALERSRPPESSKKSVPALQAAAHPKMNPIEARIRDRQSP
jgi:AcrR family transcriptional regulator